MRILEAGANGAASHTSSGSSRLGPLSLGALSPGLSAYVSESSAETASLSGLLAELLLGEPDPRWRHAGWVPGEALVLTDTGELRLRRTGASNASRLTLSPGANRPADAPAPTPAEWQAGLAPQVIAAVFFAAPDRHDPLRRLLSAPVAEAFNRLGRQKRRAVETSGAQPADERPTIELLRRRDHLAGQIEALLASRRQESGVLDESIARLDQQRAELAERAEAMRRRVRALGEQLDTEGARVRYEELSRVAEEAEGRQAADEWAPRVDELDAEVARWRATLAELEARETYVRGELARVHPDDAAPQLLLADQRASVAVAGRLLADLESEVARFAKSGDSPHCICDEAHPRLNPLVETLGQHVDRLSELVAQQDRALRTQELIGEAAQLERSQVELRRQLEHLLERRQTLWRSSRARTGRVAYGEASAERIDRTAIEADHASLLAQLRALEAELEALDRDRADAVERRRRLLDEGQLDAWQRELAAIQAELSRQSMLPGAADARATIRASDVLARLTDGAFSELRLAPGGRSIEARDRTGRLRQEEELSATERLLVAWALRLALADACHTAGVALPMLLDQPFADLDDRQAANLATAIDDYAKRGRQVIAFGRSRAGLDRWRALGVSIRRLGAGVVETPPKPAEASRTVVRERQVTRSLLLDVDDPIERLPVPLTDRVALFRRARIKSVGDLLGADPSAVAEEMASEEVTAALVALWQAHAALVCFTPGLDLAAAKLLVDCDILSVEELAEADAVRLATALRRHGASEGFVSRTESWVEGAGDHLSRWRKTGYARTWKRNRRERRERIRENASRRRSGRSERSERSSHERRSRRDRSDRGERRARRTTKTGEKKKRLRFYLEVTSEIEAAPSIGAKRAEQLTRLGVATVSQLLEADPEEVAAGLDDNRVDAATIVAWQHQAGLMCRVPGLRGHDAQVLVGCGFTTPEDIASMKPAELLEFVEPFCDTSEGQRFLRGNSRPDLAEVGQWIEGARQRRSLTVA